MLPKTITRINQYFAEISGWLLCVIVLLLTIDLVSRGLSTPIHGVGELAVFVMVSVVYLGLGHTEEIRGHVRVTALISRLPWKFQKAFNILIHLLAFGTISVVTHAVAKNALKSFNNQEAIVGKIPLLIWPVKFVIFLGCLFYLFQIILNLIAEFGKEPDDDSA